MLDDAGGVRHSDRLWPEGVRVMVSERSDPPGEFDAPRGPQRRTSSSRQLLEFRDLRRVNRLLSTFWSPATTTYGRSGIPGRFASPATQT